MEKLNYLISFSAGLEESEFISYVTEDDLQPLKVFKRLVHP